MAKRKADPYLHDHAMWLKIRNREYSQWVGRESYSSANKEVILISGVE